ncbi:hypothetical protein VZT92_006832 [Zoarces viviparus]|uniref:Uncharacterized protein n=1 Tax=Zoarces viviparus TaxID=48416 RepID=A0AAW1FQX6_ZOAVI
MTTEHSGPQRRLFESGLQRVRCGRADQSELTTGPPTPSPPASWCRGCTCAASPRGPRLYLCCLPSGAPAVPVLPPLGGPGCTCAASPRGPRLYLCCLPSGAPAFSGVDEG